MCVGDQFRNGDLSCEKCETSVQGHLHAHRLAVHERVCAVLCTMARAVVSTTTLKANSKINIVQGTAKLLRKKVQARAVVKHIFALFMNFPVRGSHCIVTSLSANKSLVLSLSRLKIHMILFLVRSTSNLSNLT